MSEELQEDVLQNLDNVLKNAEVESEPEVKPEDDSKPAEEPEPKMTDEHWSEFVLKQFADDELMEGNPTIDGLRRVTKKLLGDIVESCGKVVVAPSPANDFSATCEHTIVIAWYRETKYCETRKFTEVADVNCKNTDPEYARFASATASTRAEGRALRKALMLKRVIAAEESTNVEVDGDLLGTEVINAGQMNFINTICNRNNINVLKFINMGKDKYDSKTIHKIPYSTAARMISVLTTYQQDQKKITDNIRGYESNWREDKTNE